MTNDRFADHADWPRPKGYSGTSPEGPGGPPPGYELSREPVPATPDEDEACVHHWVHLRTIQQATQMGGFRWNHDVFFCRRCLTYRTVKWP